MLAGKLAAHFARVTGIDADAGMAGAASGRLARDPGVTIRHCRFERFAVAAGHSEADLITMVAVLHHLDLEDTLARIPGLLGRDLRTRLRPGNSLHAHDTPDPAAGTRGRTTAGQIMTGTTTQTRQVGRRAVNYVATGIM